MANAVVFERVRKSYGSTTVISELNLEIPQGSITVLVGPSGCGKTTTMKMINRLITPTSGRITVEGRDSGQVDPVQLRRSIGYVIQQVGLFPHLTIAENISLVPRLQGGKAAIDSKKIDHMLDLVGLDPEQYRERYPAELSGGQQQRVGVARALMSDPPIILMDEPFSALDPITREQLQDELIRLNQELNKTIVFVTHDMDEALKIADQIVVMQKGCVIQQGTPDQILRHPVNDFVRGFIGEKRLHAHLSQLVQDVMVAEPVTVSPGRGLAEAVQIMYRKRVTGLIVVDKNGKYLGLADTADIHKRYPDESLTVRDVMRTETITLHPTTSLTDAIGYVQEAPYGYVPVVRDDGTLAGLLTRASLVDVLARPYLEGERSEVQ
ncbi:betaine/proline/choline family ABC transporter ATP-binding protein [Brevibacillus ruminantium]|uniref:Quaternary amine transport ATP-binding protein n=1 Tax=Brevibacillus ruminantium TaxID=2950604 RepID=A0ABY4WJP8_9BACL|nr:betaine/proline/choline family ABC transporter ATP-binding protein [Brevibacillus ruminantium]USG66929.1 betaine/proline/choline family ABC transporter ATP-binding protein [Brevibacillus ruminantium]